MIDFDISFDRVIGNEGGYVNDPKDSGGETKWGISKRQYPQLNIASLTRDDAKIIYKRDYYDPVGKLLSEAVHYQVFDAAVNHGIGNAIRMLQRAVNVADDGHWGPVSQDAYAEMDENDVLFLFLAQRLRCMTKLSKFCYFGAGWSNRIATNLEYCAKDN